MKRYLAFLFFILLFSSCKLTAAEYSKAFNIQPNNTQYFIVSPEVTDIHAKCEDEFHISLTSNYLALPLYLELRPSDTEIICSVKYSIYDLVETITPLVELHPDQEQAKAVETFAQLDRYLFGSVSFSQTEIERLLNSLVRYSGSQNILLSEPALTRLMLYFKKQYEFKTSVQFAFRLNEISKDNSSLQNLLNMVLAENYFSLQQYADALTVIDKIFATTEVEQTNSQFKIAILTLYGFSQVLSGELKSDQSLQLRGKQSLEEAMALCKLSATTDCKSQIYNGLATYFRIQGQFDESAKMLELAISSLESANPSDHIERLSNLTNNLALIYRWTGDLAKSQHFLRRSIYYDKALENPVSIAISYANLANSYRMIGDLPKATRFYQRSLELSIEAGDEFNTAKTQFNLGQLLITQKNYHAAIATLTKTQEMHDKFSPSDYALLQSNLALALAHAGQALKAKELLNSLMSQDVMENNEVQHAELNLTLLEVATQMHDDVNIANLEQELDNSKLQSTSSILRLRLVELKSTIRRAQHSKNKDLKKSLSANVDDTFTRAFAEIMRTVNTLDSEEMGLNWMTRANHLTDTYVEFLLNSNEPNDHILAWLVSEQTTNLLIQRRRHYYNGRTDDSFKEQSKEYIAITTNLRKARLDSLNQNLEQQQANQLQIDSLNERQLLNHSASLKVFEDTAIRLTLIDAQKRLSEKEILLKYFLIGQRYYLLWANSQTWGLQAIPFQLTQFFKRNKLSDFSSNATLAVPFKAEDLLPKTLINNKKVDRLIIIAAGDLHNFPLAMLRDKNGQYIGEKFEIVRALSATAYLDEQVDYKHNDINGIGIFADPEFSTPQIYVGKQTDLDWHAQFQRLPWTAEIANYIKSIFTSTPLNLVTGKEATTSRLLDVNMRKSKILHIATHAYYDKDNPDMAGLVTTKDNGKSPSDQLGYLSIYDLLEHPIYSDLVIISACESQMGRNYGGEGVRGLAYSMLAQGAGSVIGTLWKIPDKPTALFMQHFYQALKNNGGNSASALHSARQKFIRSGRYKNPKYWAGFILTVANRNYEQIYLN